MGRAYAYISNNTPQTFTTSGTLAVGIAQHGFGCSNGQKTISVSGNGIALNACGYYNFGVSLNVTNSEAGNVAVSAYQDGVLIASNSTAIAAASDPDSISLDFGVLAKSSSNITFVVSASAGNPTVNSINTTVQKM